MKASLTAIIPATPPCLGPKVCCWTSSLAGLPVLASFPNMSVSFFLILFSFYLLQALGEVELRAILSSRLRYRPISNPTQSTSLQDRITPNRVNNKTLCSHLSLFLTGCGNSPYSPRHMPGLTPWTAGLSGTLSAFNKPDLWKPCVFVCWCVMEGRCGGGASTPGLMQSTAFPGPVVPLPFEGSRFRPTFNFRVHKVPVAWFCSGSGLG